MENKWKADQNEGVTQLYSIREAENRTFLFRVMYDIPTFVPTTSIQ